ncbi:hypothetical protein FQA47_002180 [Oryzias melastigma]|uniref:Uncharacterized protein n=1 Tax=Oryzias melastigma TaxID=30732 RepID=A0A834F4W0_ORYME|nr:hypothetical protein FQA47_002180 [Oryzias melastigma]
MPNAGYRLVKGTLKAQGHHLGWDRVKASMHRVDSLGILSRMTQLGYNIVIFGGIDGYSRKIPLIDWESSALVPDPHAEVQVPEFDNPLADDQMELLRENIDPLQSSESSGMDIYLQTLQLHYLKFEVMTWNLPANPESQELTQIL